MSRHCDPGLREGSLGGIDAEIGLGTTESRVFAEVLNLKVYLTSGDSKETDSTDRENKRV